MCWNEHVSLNTFAFSFFMLGLLMYNNTYTPYKYFTSPFIYFFISCFIFIQLIEFFIWRAIRLKMSQFWPSFFGLVLITLQPFASLLLLKNGILKMILLSIYSLGAILYWLFIKHDFTNKVVNYHLRWNWLVMPPLLTFSWLFFFFFSFIYNKEYFLSGFTFLLLIISIYNKSNGSMWCWLANSFLILYAIYLLIIMPYNIR